MAIAERCSPGYSGFCSDRTSFFRADSQLKWEGSHHFGGVGLVRWRSPLVKASEPIMLVHHAEFAMGIGRAPSRASGESMRKYWLYLSPQAGAPYSLIDLLFSSAL